MEPARIVKGAFDGQAPLPRQDVVTPSLHRLLVAHADTDLKLVQELVTTIFENRLDLLIRMSLSSAIRDPRSEAAAALPVHEGARRYYDRDQPSYLQENAEPIALMITIAAMIFSALLALRRNLASRAKNRGDDYNHQLLRIAHAHAAPTILLS
ncbi:MAG: TAXI family TRAP transporter solute-binding subunit [Rhizobiaceae bacterium]